MFEETQVQSNFADLLTGKYFQFFPSGKWSSKVKHAYLFTGIDPLQEQKHWARVLLRGWAREWHGVKAHRFHISSGSCRWWKRNRQGEETEPRGQGPGRKFPDGLDRPRSNREKRIVKLRPRVCVLISTGQLCDWRLLLTSAKGCSSRCDRVRLRDEAEMKDTWLVSGPSPMVSIANQQMPPGHQLF